MSRVAIIVLAMACLGATGPGGTGGPQLELDPDHEFPGASFDAHAWGFLPFEEVSWWWDGERIGRASGESTRASADGYVSATLHVPPDAQRGDHQVSVVSERGASASAPFVVWSPSPDAVYRLPSSTTSTTAARNTSEPPVTASVEAESRSEQTVPTEPSTTTTHAEDVPDRFGVRFEDAGSDGDGPSSWVPALGPAAIITLFGGRLLVRHLNREVETDGASGSRRGTTR